MGSELSVDGVRCGAVCDENCGDYRAVCSDCGRAHDSIGVCAVCRHQVARHCDGALAHQCPWTVFQRDRGPHRAVLSVR